MAELAQELLDRLGILRARSSKPRHSYSDRGMSSGNCVSAQPACRHGLRQRRRETAPKWSGGCELNRFRLVLVTA
jgi:hypothetical protein